MIVRVRVLEEGTPVRVRQPASREHGTWLVRERVAGSGLKDPEYRLSHERSQRTCVLRRSRLQVVRAEQPA
jgi:hypothetical protein